MKRRHCKLSGPDLEGPHRSCASCFLLLGSSLFLASSSPLLSKLLSNPVDRLLGTGLSFMSCPALYGPLSWLGYLMNQRTQRISFGSVSDCKPPKEGCFLLTIALYKQITHQIRTEVWICAHSHMTNIGRTNAMFSSTTSGSLGLQNVDAYICLPAFLKSLCLLNMIPLFLPIY